MLLEKPPTMSENRHTPTIRGNLAARDPARVATAQQPDHVGHVLRARESRHRLSGDPILLEALKGLGAELLRPGGIGESRQHAVRRRARHEGELWPGAPEGVRVASRHRFVGGLGRCVHEPVVGW